MNATATPARFETSTGAVIDRLPLEVFPNFRAYVYVVRMASDCILIDSGSGTDLSHERLLSGLRQLSLQPANITYILLTHAHIDHFGGLARLRPLTGAQIGVHELDVQSVAHHEARLALIGRRLRSFLSDAGLNEERRDQILSLYRFSKAIYRSVPVHFTYEAAGMQVGPVELIHLPGHCPGHVAMRLDDVVFCGDLVVEGVTPHLAPESINPYSGLDHYLESLHRLQSWSRGARLVLNGHDDPIVDLPAQIEATKQNILRRMSKASEALAEPQTIEQVCLAVYGEMSGYNQVLVIEKTGAYLEYLYEHALIEITNPEEMDRGMPARYRRLREAHAMLAELERGMNMHAGTQVQT
jgi:glyoxylase-like metal-dependent hydrolase (beta-lactamase superfamily II)